MIRFRFQPTLKDWVAFHRIVVLRQFRFLNVLALVIIAIFLIYPYALRAADHEVESVVAIYWNNIGTLFVPFVAGLLVGWIHYSVKKRWRTAEEMREARDYEIDETGVRVTGSSLSGYLEWRHFTTTQRKGGYFLLKTAQNQFHYFPEAIVPDTKALAALLEEHVRARGRSAR